MRILNVGCGGTRPQGEKYVNLDNLRTQLPLGSAARDQLDSESNYVEFDIFSGPLPFNEGDFDGVALLHCAEHFNAQDGLKLMQNCFHILKPKGVFLVSVPNASYFRHVDAEDKNENWPRLFEVTDPNNPIPTFREAALFFSQHEVLFTEDALWCYLRQAGFPAKDIKRLGSELYNPVLEEMKSLLNRIPFSLIMSALKP